MDNNSTDNSFEIALNIALNDSRVKVFKELKQGAAAARNRGFDESKGDLIYFYDVDDQLFDDTLFTLSSLLTSDQSLDAVFGKMLKSNKDVTEIRRSDLEETPRVIKKINLTGVYYGLTI